MLSLASPAQADDCLALGGSLVAGECQIAGAQIKAGTFTLDETLHILDTGSITVPPAAGGNSLTLNITGDLIMDLGGRIVGNVSGGSAVGATITITASDDILLEGNGANGARITSNQTGGCSTGEAGDITLTAADITTQAGSIISANGSCPAGDIVITSINTDINGLVESKSTLSGTGAIKRPGGGTIFITSSCRLLVGNTGRVSSIGSDSGADLVHLEGGCQVLIQGLVESTGRGHGVPNDPPNLCSTPNRPDKAANATACVEIWAGDSLTINGLPLQNGEINADVGSFGGTGGTSWIDLYARGDIAIIGDTAGPFAAHANGVGSSSDEGGTVTVASVEGTVTASGRALQADAIRPGGDGGRLSVEADGSVILDTASLFAQGDINPAGGLGSGGTIVVRTFDGSLSWQDGDGNVQPVASGTITLTACGAIDTTGTAFHGEVPTTTSAVCGGAPTLPAYVTLPSCACGALPGTTPPTCQVPTMELWPPNHKFVPVSPFITDPDGDPVSVTINSIFQDEPVNAPGSGNFCPDATGVGTGTAQIRVERAGPQDGRVYHVFFTADDGQGNVCQGELILCVPHDQKPGHVCVDQGPLFNSTVCP